MSKASSTSTRSASSEIPFTRRRLLPEQIAALQALFQAKSHPSKEERGAIAAELGLELKSVNVWYQNRRRSAKKQALAWKPATLPISHRIPTNAKNPASLSLDRVATSRERRDVPSRSSRLPSTPKANRTRSEPEPIPSQTELWEHIPSSPQAPPSSPGAESERLSKLPSGSKTLRSLEWACAKARAEGKLDEESDDEIYVTSLNISASPPRKLAWSKEVEDMIPDFDEQDTDIELDEAITPDTSFTLSSASVATSSSTSTSAKRQWKRRNPEEKGTSLPSEQMEAAMTLLVFKDS